MVGSKKKVDDEKMSPDPKIRKITKLRNCERMLKRLLQLIWVEHIFE